MKSSAITKSGLLCAAWLTACFSLSFSARLHGAHPLAQWHPRFSLPSGGGFADVTWGNGRLVAIGSGTAVVSTNGVDWELHNTGIAGYAQAVTYGNGRFVAVGLDGLAIASTDGIQWTEILPSSSGSKDFYDVIYGNGLFVAIGELGRIETSPNGTTWSAQSFTTSTPFSLHHITHGQGLFLSPFTPGTNLVSADGTNWQPRASGTTNNLYAVGFGGGTFLAVDTRLRVWTSLDATAWSSFGSITGIRPPEVEWGNGQFLILANPAPEYSSASGSWTPSPTNIAASGAVFANGTFVITAGRTIYQSDPVIHLATPGPGAIRLSGPPGTYAVEVSDLQAGAPSWQWRTNVLMTTSPLLWNETSPTASSRFYRAILQP